jgi:hypothetical protein
MILTLQGACLSLALLAALTNYVYEADDTSCLGKEQRPAYSSLGRL